MAADSMLKASTHEPLGKKDLWNTPGLQLPAYVQHIAQDLMQKRGMSRSQAIATAIAAVKRWAVGGGNVDATTRAAAQKALAEWEAAKAKARATPNAHAHSNVEGAVELADPSYLIPAVTSGDGPKITVNAWSKAVGTVKPRAKKNPYTADMRRTMAKQGMALPDGSFPIGDRRDLANAAQAVGRAPAAKRAAARMHIRKRAKALGVNLRSSSVGTG